MPQHLPEVAAIVVTAAIVLALALPELGPRRPEERRRATCHLCGRRDGPSGEEN